MRRVYEAVIVESERIRDREREELALKVQDRLRYDHYK